MSSSSPRDCLFIASALSIIMMGTTLPTPLYSHYQHSINFNETWMTIIFAAYSLGVLCALVLAGGLSDKIGRKPTIRLGLLIGVLSSLSFLTATSISILVFARILSGISAGLMLSAATITIMELAPRTWGQHSSLLATAANTLGIGLGPLFSGAVMNATDNPGTLIFITHLIALICCTIAANFTRETASILGRARMQISMPEIPPAIRPLFIPLALAGFAGFSISGLFSSLSPALMREVMHLSNNLTIGLTVAGFFASSAFGQLFLNRIPLRRQHVTGCASLAAGALTLWASTALACFPLLITATVLCGIGQGIALRSGLTCVALASPPKSKAAVASALFVVFYLSVSIPVVAMGASIPQYGLSLTTEFFSLGIAVISISTLGLAWITNHTKQLESAIHSNINT